jgi:hypothetical protein
MCGKSVRTGLCVCWCLEVECWVCNEFVYVMRKGGVVMYCYLCGYSLSFWCTVSNIGLFNSLPNSFICVFVLLVRKKWYFSKLLKNFPLYAFLNIVNVSFSIFPYICPESNMWRECPVSGRLLRMAWRCSLYLILNVLPVCPMYFFGQSKHCSW